MCVEHYIKVAKARRLSTHGPAEVRAFLDERGSRPRVQGWQLAQSAHAIQIVFCDVIEVSWCCEVDWMRWWEEAGVLSADYPSIARDAQPLQGKDFCVIEVFGQGPYTQLLN
jgi:hypothetical protein